MAFSQATASVRVVCGRSSGGSAFVIAGGIVADVKALVCRGPSRSDGGLEDAGVWLRGPNLAGEDESLEKRRQAVTGQDAEQSPVEIGQHPEGLKGGHGLQGTGHLLVRGPYLGLREVVVEFGEHRDERFLRKRLAQDGVEGLFDDSLPPAAIIVG